MSNQIYKAILLMGPSGVGKTPVGDLCEKRGFAGKKCFHFDFGRNLRRASMGKFSKDILSPGDVALIQSVLATGALLENDTFFIAEKILFGFIHDHQIDPADLIILNGLPRHIDQANDTAAMISIQSVILLECLPEVVFERIRLNSGGDRTNRKDDSLAEIRNKLEIYTRRTLPLLTYFSNQNIPITSVCVDVHTSPDDVVCKF